MSFLREIKCENCGTLVGIREVDVFMPYKTEETAECPVCGKTIFRKNSRGDFEAEVVSTDDTKEPYKSQIKNEAR